MTKEVKLEKVVYADWHSAYRAWVTGLDTEPPLEGAFFAGWLVRDAEIERIQRDGRVTLELLSQARAAANAQRAINDALGAGEYERLLDAAREFHNFKSDGTHRVLNPTCRLCVALDALGRSKVG